MLRIAQAAIGAVGGIMLFYGLLNLKYKVRYASDRDCGSHKLAVVIPFRNVFDELMELVPKLHNFLTNQCVDHEIFVINQADAFRFNKGSLINIGYLVSKEECDYMALHDVDLLPLNLELKYSYPENGPFHVASPEYHPFLNGETYIGGILLITMEQFRKVRGMTNKIWGWGGEDNELYMRILKENMTIYRNTGLRTGKNNTFKNLHNEVKRSRDKKRFLTEHKNVFKVEPNTGFHNIQYEIFSRVRMTIENCPITVYNVGLKCNVFVEEWCALDE